MENFDFDMFEQEKALSEERPGAAQKEKKKEERRKRQKLFNLAFALIFALVFIAALVLAAPFAFAKYNPERYAKQYIEAVIAKDYGGVYDNSEGRAYANFGREEFVAACEASPQLLSLADYEITDFAVQKYGAAEGDMQNMLVTFTGAEGETGTYIFPMQKISNGFWKYDEYAAVLTFDIVCSAKIYAPLQTSVYLNGEPIDTELMKTVDSIAADGAAYSYLEYSISPMLAGSYTVKATNGFCTDYEESIEISKTNSDIYISMTLSDEAITDLITAAQSNITTIYNGAAAAKLKAEELPLTERFAQNEFDALSKSLGDKLYGSIDYITVSDFEISNIELTQQLGEQTLTAFDDGKITLPLSFDYSYKLTNKEYTYSDQTEEHSANGYAIITYSFASGKWQLDGIALQADF